MYYALPMLAVASPIPFFFLLARGGFVHFNRLELVLRILVAVVLLVAACGHLMWPGVVATAVPPAFPHPYALAIGSGICEALGGIGLMVVPVRRMTSLLLAFFMVAIFPANVYIAGKTFGPITFPGVPLRAVLQVVFIVMILLGGWGVPRSIGSRPR